MNTHGRRTAGSTRAVSGPGALGLVAPGLVALILCALGPVTAAAAAPVGTRLLASGPSGTHARIEVLGAGAGRVVIGRVDPSPGAGGVYLDLESAPDTGGPLVSLGGADANLGSVSVAGSTLLYSVGDEFQYSWVDLATGATGKGPDVDGGLNPTWQTAVPGGGAWISGNGTAATLLTTTTAAPEALPTALATLPGFRGSGEETAAAADTNGIAAVAGTTVDYYSFATHTARTLDTRGVLGPGFSCTAITATAIGCVDAGQVVRVPTDGSPPTILSAPGAGAVAVGPRLTAWVRQAGPSAPGILFTDVAGHVTHTATTAPDVSGVAAVGDDVEYSNVGDSDAGVYRAAAAGALRTLVVAAPTVPFRTDQIALTAGRVAWIDNSVDGYPVESRAVASRGRAAPALGPTVDVSGSSAATPDQAALPFSGLGASGTRTLYLDAGHRVGNRLVGGVVLYDPTAFAVYSPYFLLARAAAGPVALSGSHALWATPAGRLVLSRLVDDSRTGGISTDLTRFVGTQLPGVNGALTGALYGRYLVYARGGYARRLDLVTHRSVVIGRDAPGQNAGGIATAGDWVAWQSKSSPRSPIRYRNARTLGRTRTVTGRTLVSVSQAGFASMTAAGRQVFRVWGSSREVALPTTFEQSPVRVDGGLMAWIGPDGYPRVAPLPASAARPQALGAPFTTAVVSRGATWRLNQVTSQVLTSCTVVVKDGAGRIVKKLGCPARGAAQGEASVAWRVPGRLPTGRYTWQVVARDPSGTVLAATGSPGTPVAGRFAVTR